MTVRIRDDVVLTATATALHCQLGANMNAPPPAWSEPGE